MAPACPGSCASTATRWLEVNRPNRQLRRQKGKDDPLDAESAARAVLAGQAAALPKSGTSTVEMIRHFKVARDTAVKGRTQAMQMLKAIGQRGLCWAGADFAWRFAAPRQTTS